ncbi:MAG TPA: magnesium chelatase [Bryobacterales bacterium]|nr:magnesium chelatase [Bryobacterales bacterium]
MKPSSYHLPVTLGELRQSEFDEKRVRGHNVKNEMRANLICRMERGEPLFPGIIGYDDTVIPQVVNAILSRHHFILLGLRGQAKTRLLRSLTDLLDPALPYVAGCEIHDNPYAPICQHCRLLLAERGDATPIAYLTPEARYIEKLATPDVTIADMIGDLDPIKAARGGLDLSSELTIHYGLLPRAHRGIFAINELPDLAGKIQVGLFNIMQEGDVQIKGYPVRLPLDVLLVFTANPDDYTARGKIITPLKDRIGSEIRTHYPVTLDHGISITEQEAWLERATRGGVCVPNFIKEVVESVAFLAREEKKIDKRSGVSQRLPITCLENVLSNAERRAIRNKEHLVVPRVSDIYAALPSLTGKFELEYEGELKGADFVARELIRGAVGRIYTRYFDGVNVSQIVQWFELGGTLKIRDAQPSSELLKQLEGIQGLMDVAKTVEAGLPKDPAVKASAAEFVLDGLYAHRRISRNEELGYVAEEKKRETREHDDFPPRGFRKHYN